MSYLFRERKLKQTGQMVVSSTSLAVAGFYNLQKIEFDSLEVNGSIPETTDQLCPF